MNWGHRALQIEAEYFRAFAKGSSHPDWSDRPVFAAVTGRDSNDKNGVVAYTAANPERIIEAIEWVLSRNVPSTLFCPENDCPDSVLQYLAARNIKPDCNSVCMGVPTHAVQSVVNSTSVNVREVSTSLELVSWLNVAEASGWISDSSPMSDRECQSQGMLASFEKSNAIALVAEQESESNKSAIGMMNVFFSEKTSLLTDIAIIESEQKNGYGSTLLNSWLNLCHEREIENLVLFPTSESRQLYLRFGFQEFPIPKNRIFYLN